MRNFHLIGIALLIAGCNAPYQSPQSGSDPRVFVTFDAGVYSEPVVIESLAPLKGSIRLVNPNSTDQPIKQTTDWFNASGQPIKTLLSSPETLVVPRMGDAYIKLLSPTPSAVQFKVRVEPDLTN